MIRFFKMPVNSKINSRTSESRGSGGTDFETVAPEKTNSIVYKRLILLVKNRFYILGGSRL